MKCFSQKIQFLILLKMNYINSLILVTILLNCVTAAPEGSPQEDTLVLLHVLFRHGNRTPDKMSSFPNDIYKNFTYYPFGYSQLTTKGKQTAYNIGKYLRTTYDDFLPKQYTPDAAYSVSTNFKRTKMTLELVLASLFPPTKIDKFFPSQNWQPASFVYEDGPGTISVASLYCATYINAYWAFATTREAQSIYANYKRLYAEIEKLGGFEINSPRELCSVYFTFKSQDDFGLELPRWGYQYYPKILEEACSVIYELSTANAVLKKFSAGFLLKKIIDDSNLKKNGSLPEDRKIFLYSAHEYNVAAMLRTLGVFYRHVPPFGATVIFEVHNINGVYGIKLFYEDYTGPKPKALKIPGCPEFFCSLDKLYELVKTSLPTQYDVCDARGEFL